MQRRDANTVWLWPTTPRTDSATTSHLLTKFNGIQKTNPKLPQGAMPLFKGGGDFFALVWGFERGSMAWC